MKLLMKGIGEKKKIKIKFRKEHQIGDNLPKMF